VPERSQGPDETSERDELRRLLTVAVANERRAFDDVQAAREVTKSIEQRFAAQLTATEARLAEEAYARGIADGRAGELERTRAALAARHASELSAARDREWAERDERRREHARLLVDLGEARLAVRELRAERARERDEPVYRAARFRASIATRLGWFFGLAALAFAPAAWIAAFSPSRAAYLTLALDLGPWELAAFATGCGLAAFLFATVAYRCTRRAHGPLAAGADDAAERRAPGASQEAARGPALASNIVRERVASPHLP